MDNIHKYFATFFAVGYLPKCPGTWGSLTALVIPVLLPQPSVLIPLTILFFFWGRWASDHYAKSVSQEDPKEVVIDEVVGIMVTFFFIPITPLTLVLGFAFFRFFDITKKFGVGKVEHYPNGWGIMYDDLLAGVYANFLLQGIVKFVF